MRATSYAGGEHSLHKTKEGKLKSSGACGLGWCRHESLNPSLFQFRNVPIPEPIRQVHASYYHNLALGKNSGRLYSWGCGTFTEGNLDGVIPALGQGKDGKDIGGFPQIVKLPLMKTTADADADADGSEESIIDISGGAYHSAVLLDSGRILTFGAGQLGQLGRSSTLKDASGLPVDPEPKEAKAPALNGMPQKIKKIGSGFYNTFAITTEGKLFCTGENQNQQCGAIGHKKKNLLSLSHVKEVEDEVVEDVKGGYCHTLVKTLAGKVFSLGCGDDGQRGDGKEGDDPGRPVITEVNVPVKVAQIAAGANHSIVLGEDGNVFAFGANDVGQCGVKSDDPIISNDDNNDDHDEDDHGGGGSPILSPKIVKLPSNAGKIVHVSAGYAHSVLTAESGKTFVFGQNDNGQLGFGGNNVECGEDPVQQDNPIEVMP